MVSIRSTKVISPLVIELYEAAFPAEERRPLPAQHRLLQEGALCLLEVEKDGRFAGFVFCWQLTDFTFVEHFAIDPVMRGKGSGSKVMTLLFERYGRLVLETEPPHTVDAQRRIRFYEALGFGAFTSLYLQPPYREGWDPLEMILMQKGMSLSEHTFSKISSEIYRDVYGL
jgi:ribosomal protein S18 acetylase RimI-like enzyme